MNDTSNGGKSQEARLVESGLAKFVEMEANNGRLATALTATQSTLRETQEVLAGVRADLLAAKAEVIRVVEERDRWMRFATTLITQLGSAILLLNDGLAEAKKQRDALGDRPAPHSLDEEVKSSDAWGDRNESFVEARD